MSPAEYIEAAVALNSLAASHAMNFFTIVAAFLVAVYFVSEHLNRTEAWVLTILFTVFSWLPGSSAVDTISMWVKLLRNFREEHSKLGMEYYPEFASEPYLPIALAAVFAVIWSVSVIYMVRRRSNIGGAT